MSTADLDVRVIAGSDVAGRKLVWLRKLAGFFRTAREVQREDPLAEAIHQALGAGKHAA